MAVAANEAMRHALLSEILTPCLVGAVALALGGCNASERGSGGVESAQASPAPEVDIDDLQDDASEWAGREVRIIGEIDDPSHGDHAFVIEGDDWVMADEVLVIAATPMHLDGTYLEDGEEVVVIGTVRVGDMPALERDVGWPISESMADEWEDKAIVVAHTVRSIRDGGEWLAEPAPSPSMR
jgi:hypothetical protein